MDLRGQPPNEITVIFWLDDCINLLTHLPALTLCSLFSTPQQPTILLKPQTDHIPVLLKTFENVMDFHHTQNNN